MDASEFKPDYVTGEVSVSRVLGRRRFIKELIGAGLGLGALGGVMLYGAYLDSEREREYCTGWLDRMEVEKPGYKVSEPAENIVQIDLLPTGKTRNDDCNSWRGEADKKGIQFSVGVRDWTRNTTDIRQETLGEALTEIGRRCDVVDVDVISSSGGNTDGLIVRVANCR